MNELPRPQSMAEHLPTRRFALAVITGALLMGVAYGAMAGVGFVTDVRVPVVAITISALLTGFLAGRGGALAGFASWLVVSLAWALVGALAVPARHGRLPVAGNHKEHAQGRPARRPQPIAW